MEINCSNICAGMTGSAVVGARGGSGSALADDASVADRSVLAEAERRERLGFGLSNVVVEARFLVG